MTSTRPLLSLLPHPERLPHTCLASLPTAVQPLEALAKALDYDSLWVKRDDLSGALYGGNKVRKLEFIFGEALEAGHHEVMTIGAIGSHHVLATCLYARQLGLKPCAQHFPQPISPHVLKNLRALSTTRPELELVGHPVELPFHRFKQHLLERLRVRPNTFYITGGGSSVAGVMGYVNAALELVEQIERGELERPDRVLVAAGTNGTLAGLIVGFKLAGEPIRVTGVRVVDRVVTNAANVLALAHATVLRLRELGLGHVPGVSLSDFELLDDCFGSSYGEPTTAGVQALDLMQRFEGLVLDPTYTAKTVSALLDAKRRKLWRGERVLYWHTLNGVDLGPLVAKAQPLRDLPESYHAFFREDSAT